MSDQNKFSAPAAPPSTAGNGGANNISLLSSLMESPESRTSNKRTIKATRKFDEQQVIAANTKRQPKPRKILDASEMAEEEKVPVNVQDTGKQLVGPLYNFIEEDEEDEEEILEDEAEEEDDGDEDEDDDEEDEEDDDEEDANGQPKKSKSSGKKRKSKATSRKLWNQTVSISSYL